MLKSSEELTAQSGRGKVCKVSMPTLIRFSQNLSDPSTGSSLWTIPMEILVHIFDDFVPLSIGIHEIWDADAIKHFSKRCPCTTAHAKLVAVSQVVHRWRTIGFSYPSFRRPVWTSNHSNTLKRARNTPLEDIDIQSTRHLDECSSNRYALPANHVVGRDIYPFRKHKRSYNPMLLFWNVYSGGKFIKILHISSAIPDTAK